MPNFNDPSYGFGDPASGIGGLFGPRPIQQGGILGSSPWSTLLDPQVALPIAAQLIGGRTFQDSLAGGFAAAGTGLVAARKKQAINDWIKAGAPKDIQHPATINLMNSVPELATSVFAQQFREPTATMQEYNKAAEQGFKGSILDYQKALKPTFGMGVSRGDGSTPDLRTARSVYDATYGTGANLSLDAPGFEGWYTSTWPAFGDNPPTPAAANPRERTSLSIGRGALAANRVVRPYLDNPTYKLMANAPAYLSRIEAAKAHPGSVSDQELVDSLVKLNTGGNQVTEAQIAIITHGKSFTDQISVWQNYLAAQGGEFSDDQRAQIQDLAHAMYRGYRKLYQPLYDRAIKAMKDQGVPEANWSAIPDINTLSREGGIDPETGVSIGGGAGGSAAPGGDGWTDLGSGVKMRIKPQ